MSAFAKKVIEEEKEEIIPLEVKEVVPAPEEVTKDRRAVIIGLVIISLIIITIVLWRLRRKRR